VLLSLGMLNNGAPKRSCPAANVTATSASVPFTGCAARYDFDPATNPDATGVRRAYASYAVYVAGRLANATGAASGAALRIVHATEVNMYDDGGASDAQWGAVVDFANQVYGALKNAHPAALVFPSFQAEYLKGTSTADQPCYGKTGAATAPCEVASLARIAGFKRDVFALSVYGKNGAGFPPTRPSANFSHYLESLFEKLPSATERLAIAETGWLQTDITVDARAGPLQPHQCTNVVLADGALAAAWQDYLLGQFATAGQLYADRFDLITWWSGADLMPREIMTACPCPTSGGGDDKEFCTLIDAFRQAITPPWLGETLFKAFGAMGLRGYDGAEGPLLAKWRAHCQTCAPPPRVPAL